MPGFARIQDSRIADLQDPCLALTKAQTGGPLGSPLRQRGERGKPAWPARPARRA